MDQKIFRCEHFFINARDEFLKANQYIWPKKKHYNHKFDPSLTNLLSQILALLFGH